VVEPASPGATRDGGAIGADSSGMIMQRFRLLCGVFAPLLYATADALAGLLREMDGARIEAGLPTPWVGVKERIGWYAYHAWFAALALTLLRRNPT
jgi:hypothetical protein